MPRIIKMAKGTYTSSTITVDGEGRVITAASGSGGGAVGTTTVYNSPGTHTSSPSSIYMNVAVAGGGGGSKQGGSAPAGGTSSFGTLASAPGGNGGGDNTGAGNAGTYSNNLYWAIGNTQSGSPNLGGIIGGSSAPPQSDNAGKSRVGGSPVIVLRDAGNGGINPISWGGGSGGVNALVLTEPQYTAGAGVPVTTGTYGTGDANGTGGRVVVVEYAT